MSAVEFSAKGPCVAELRTDIHASSGTRLVVVSFIVNFFRKQNLFYKLLQYSISMEGNCRWKTTAGRYKSIISILDKIDCNRYFSILINRLISKVDNNR